MRIVASHPQSPYADDAALALAIGAANFEHRPLEALERLQAVAQQFAASGTILAEYSPYRFHEVDPVWWQAVVVLLQAKPGPRGQTVFPDIPVCDVEARLGFRDQCATSYALHLQVYPVSTRQYALLTANLIKAGDKTKVREVLDGLKAVAEVDARFEEIAAIDRKASGQPTGYYIGLLRRPAVVAMQRFFRCCNSSDLTDEGIAAGARIVPKMSPDGWFWELNQGLGDLYRKKAAGGPSPEAVTHYTLALSGYLAEVRREADFKRQLGGGEESLPLDQIESQVRQLKKAIVAVGGQADPRKSELGFLKEIFAKPSPPPLPEDLSKDSVIERIKRIVTEHDVYPRPEDRVRALEEQKAWFLGKVKDLAPDHRNQAIEPRRYLTLMLALAAKQEEDAAARKAILAEVASLVAYRPSSNAPSPGELAGIQRRVDDLVAKALVSEGAARDAAIGSLRNELPRLPSHAIEYLAGHLCRRDLPEPVQKALLPPLRSPVPCPRAFPKLLELLNVNRSPDVCQYACDALQAILLVCPMDADGVFSDPAAPSKAERPPEGPVKVVPKASPFNLRKDTLNLIKDKRDPVEDQLRAHVLATIEDETLFRNLVKRFNQRWDVETIGLLGTLLVEDCEKATGERLRRPREVSALLTYLQAHECPRGFREGERTVVTELEWNRVASVRTECATALDRYYQNLLGNRDTGDRALRDCLRYNIPHALLKYGTPEMITERIWTAVENDAEFRYCMLGVMTMLATKIPWRDW
jgi:hypothetical protein